MRKSRFHHAMSWLMAFAMVVSMLSLPSFAASSCKLVFDYPEDVPAEDVMITVFDGVPQWRQKNVATTVEGVIEAFTNPTNASFPKLNVIEPNADGSYTVSDAHGYCYFVRGKEPGHYYNIIKLFVVSEADLASGVKHIAVKTGPSAGTGFESGNNNPVGADGEKAPANFNQGVQHMVPIEGTDEMEHLMGTADLKDYKPFTTPAFSKDRAMYQATTQQEMMAFIAEYAAKSPYMHVYSGGTTSNYGYDYPVLVFTKKNIPASASMEDAAQILKDGGLPIVWQQAQIHPYEPAAGESALVMIQELCGEYGESVLDSIDVVMIPRINVEGGFLFWRGDYNGTDMNRDHMVCSAEQTAMLHDVYYTFDPHVVIDNHEFFFSEMGNYNNNPEEFKLNDFQITGATSLNDDSIITDITTNLVVDKMHKDLADYGFRPFHYGITSNNPIGRAYYGLDNAISILIESHGADGALFAMPRRVYGQVIATKSIYDSTVANGTKIVKAVNEARAKVVEKGKTYDENDILVLKQSASGKITSPTPLKESVADIYGNIRTISESAINLQDTIVRGRARPTAYIVDARVDWLDKLTYILDHQNAEYFMLEKGTCLEVEQYYYIDKDGAKSCIAGLRDKQEATFPEGCLMIPMDQEVGTIIGMLMEPDVGDSSSYNGTLFQYGLLKQDPTTNDFPLYRYTVDNARDVLLDTGFEDVANEAYYRAPVAWAVKNGITGGTSATTFSPEDACTRAQAMTFLWACAGRPEPTAPCTFKDVPADAWYAKAVAWATENGITAGTGDNAFSPDETCDRAQIVTFLWAMANRPEPTAASTFKDVPADAWYAKAVAWAAENGITAGTGDNAFSPDASCTRGQIVTILHACV